MNADDEARVLAVLQGQDVARQARTIATLVELPLDRAKAPRTRSRGRGERARRVTAKREERLVALVEDLDRILHAKADPEIVVVAARGAIALWRIEDAEK